MEMPTPCPQCGECVELNDMNPCDSCEVLYCEQCLEEPWIDCQRCIDKSL